MTETSNAPIYLYLDVETPGLYAEQGVLEVAWFATTDINDLHPVITSRLNADIDVDRARDEAIDFVKAMHAKSGLWARLERRHANPELVSLQTLDREIAKEIGHVQWQHRTSGPVYLVGNSIRLDRAVLERWFPRVSKALHYRQIDITSVRLFLEGNGIDTTPPQKVEPTHVAGQDIMDSMDFARHLGKLVTRPRAALRTLGADLEGLMDSLDEHVKPSDMYDQLKELREDIRKALS